MATAESQARSTSFQRGAALSLMQSQSRRNDVDSESGGDGESEENQVPVMEMPQVSYAAPANTEQARWSKYQSQLAKESQRFTGSPESEAFGSEAPSSETGGASRKQSPQTRSSESSTEIQEATEKETYDEGIGGRKMARFRPNANTLRIQQEQAYMEASKKVRDKFRGKLWNTAEAVLAFVGIVTFFPEIASEAIGGVRLVNGMVGGSDAIPSQSLGKNMLTVGRLLFMFILFFGLLLVVGAALLGVFSLLFDALPFL